MPGGRQKAVRCRRMMWGGDGCKGVVSNILGPAPYLPAAPPDIPTR